MVSCPTSKHDMAHLIQCKQCHSTAFEVTETGAINCRDCSEAMDIHAVSESFFSAVSEIQEEQRQYKDKLITVIQSVISVLEACANMAPLMRVTIANLITQLNAHILELKLK